MGCSSVAETWGTYYSRGPHLANKKTSETSKGISETAVVWEVQRSLEFGVLIFTHFTPTTVLYTHPTTQLTARTIL